MYRRGSPEALPLDFIAAALGLSADETVKWLTTAPGGLTVRASGAGGKEVSFPPNSENQLRPKTYSEHESIRFDSMLSLIDSIGPCK